MTMYEWPDERAFRPNEKAKWLQALEARRNNVPNVNPHYVDRHWDVYEDEIVNTLNLYGHAILPGLANANALENLRVETERLFDSGEKLWRDQKKPQSVLRNTEAFTAIEQPILNTPQMLDVVFSTPFLYNVALKYIGAAPSLSGANLRKSFVNGIPETETQIYHVDPNSPRFLKIFFYMNDVDEQGGPFQYVSNSYREKFEGWTNTYRYNDQDIHKIYGTHDVVKCVGKVGDIIIADTNAFHRGTKPKSQDRLMLTVDFMIHPEFFNPPVFHIKNTEIERLKSDYPWLQGRDHAFDFLVKV